MNAIPLKHGSENPKVERAISGPSQRRQRSSATREKDDKISSDAKMRRMEYDDNFDVMLIFRFLSSHIFANAK
jgi:hypothetical protein